MRISRTGWANSLSRKKFAKKSPAFLKDVRDKSKIEIMESAASEEDAEKAPQEDKKKAE